MGGIFDDYKDALHDLGKSVNDLICDFSMENRVIEKQRKYESYRKKCISSCLVVTGICICILIWHFWR